MANVSEVSVPSKEKTLDSKHRKGPQHNCAACAKVIWHAGTCDPCWQSLKIFRRYLRETLRLKPIHGDVPVKDQVERFRYWTESRGGRGFRL